MTMKKYIIVFVFITLHNCFLSAQSYPFNLDSNDEFIYCEMKEYVKINDDVGRCEGKCSFFVKKRGLVSGFEFSICATNQNGFVDLCNNTKVQEDGYKYTKPYNVKIVLDNGEILTLDDSQFIDRRNENFQDSYLIGLGSIVNSFLKMKSSRNSLNGYSDLRKQQYFTQQLRTQNISELSINNVTIKFTTFKTKDTFNEMFNSLGAKIGHPELFQFSNLLSNNSSSSISSSRPSVTAEIGYLCIMSNGDILCRLDNVQIKGAKGKEVDIYVHLDDVNTDNNVFVLDKKVTPSYDSSTYNSIILKRNVHDSYSLFPKSGGQFKAYATFYMDTGRKGEGGYGVELEELGETRSKYINIFRKSNGTWGNY